MHRSFGYDLLEPVRRDFDHVLTQCGQRPRRGRSAESAVRPDYTLLEHARDFAGALRWFTGARAPY